MSDQHTLIASYVQGTQVANSLASLGDAIDVDAFIKGIQEHLAGTDMPYSEQEIAAAMQAFEQKARAAQQAAQESAGAEHKEAGDAFLAENAKKDGIQVTASGLQYTVLKDGEGAKPSPSDAVTVHYIGRLTDGSKFDSSVDRGQPFSLPALSGVIQGWIEGLQLMPEGATYRFWIPHDLGYGPGGQGPIPPYAVLEFDIELIKVGA